jgi:DNA-binding response OmpR family regulator
MLATDGAVVSKERLAAIAWDTTVDAHTVEVTVNRLRRKLGPAAAALETSNRRGYRIAV